MADDNDKRRKPADHATELKDLVVGYAKQETVDPLKTLGTYVGWGVGGSLLIAIGSVFLLLALLRGLQSLSAFDGTGAASLVPYAATFVAALVIVGLAAFKITKDDQKGSRS